MSSLLCTHYLEEADRLAERVVILDEGRVVAKGPFPNRRQFITWPSKQPSPNTATSRFDLYGAQT